MENPWNVHSIYELQYFNCPSCEFKDHSKQQFINHAFGCHPISIDCLSKINDGSLKDIACPWVIQGIKIEDNFADNVLEDPLEMGTCSSTDYLLEKNKDIKTPDNLHTENVKKSSRAFTCNKTYKCKECEMTFGYYKELRKHLVSIHEVNKTPKCDSCEKTYSSFRSLDKHVRKVHKGIMNFKCAKCDKIFASKSFMEDHFSNAHEGEKMYQCDKCGQAFSASKNLSLHVTNAHPGTAKNFHCDMCPFTSYFESALNVHVNNVHN